MTTPAILRHAALAAFAWALTAMTLSAMTASAAERAPGERPLIAIVATRRHHRDEERSRHGGAGAGPVGGRPRRRRAQALADLARIEVTEFSNVPSDYMGPELWPGLSRQVDALLARPEIAGAVVLHGTDTLDQTAYFLDLTLRSTSPS